MIIILMKANKDACLKAPMKDQKSIIRIARL